MTKDEADFLRRGGWGIEEADGATWIYHLAEGLPPAPMKRPQGLAHVFIASQGAWTPAIRSANAAS